jgi:hypothetical protein
VSSSIRDLLEEERAMSVAIDPEDRDTRTDRTRRSLACLAAAVCAWSCSLAMDRPDPSPVSPEPPPAVAAEVPEAPEAPEAPDLSCVPCSLDVSLQWETSLGSRPPKNSKRLVDTCGIYSSEHWIPGNRTSRFCLAPLACDALSAEMGRIRMLLRDPDVQEALEKGQNFSDRSLLLPISARILVQDESGAWRSFTLRSRCSRQLPGCTEPPASVSELWSLLQRLDQAMREVAPCRTTPRPRPFLRP